ncbi:riboflavin synthase [Myxococcota bacterium]|nr:riboflavin synthase [Myxococcota bacterium]PKN27887.1 MAG: riboflavin synthase [Deltaproteobacteria bacterium HGW-Deltaproteobacteria-22]
MFTGLVEQTGQLLRIDPQNTGRRLAIRTSLADDPTGIAIGDSLAVNGICLTVVALGGGIVEVEAGPETLSRTTMGEWHKGRLLNLERAMRADGRWGGHFVSGHIDGMGRISALTAGGLQTTLGVVLPESLLCCVVDKGSIALDGVSLTVSAIRGSTVEVAMIPHTRENTVFRVLRVGERVNVETDMLGKYIVQYLSHRKGLS